MAAILALIFSYAWVLPATAVSGFDVSITPLRPAASPASQEVGSQFQYTIDYTCSQCTDTVITIPLAAAAGFDFVATQNQTTVPTRLVNGNLEIPLGAVDGSFNLTLTMQAPIGPTPSGTTWTFRPQISAADRLPAAASTSVTGTYTAPFAVSMSKTATPSTVFAEDEVTFSLINFACEKRYLDTARIVDTLPAGLTFVSASHGGTYDATTREVTWTITGNDIGGTCGTGTTNAVTVVAQATKEALGGKPMNVVDNTATIFATSPDGVSSQNTTGTGVRIYADKNYPHGKFIKYASSLTNAGTQVGAYRGERVEYELRADQEMDGYQVAFTDPLPCRTTRETTGTATAYNSRTDGGVCTDPLLTDIQILALGNLPADWAPSVRLTDGSTVTLTGSGPWTAPAGTAEVLFPARPIDNDTDFLIVKILAKMPTDIEVGAKVTNTATATFTHPDGGTSAGSWSAYHIITDQTRLGAIKVLTGTDEPGNFFTNPHKVDASASVTAAQALTTDIVITDLLPPGHYVRSDKPIQLIIPDRQNNWLNLTAPVEIIDNFHDSGRQMVRVRITAAELNKIITDWSAGPFEFAPSLRFYAQAPAPGTFTNTSQAFYSDEAVSLGCSSRSEAYDDTMDLDNNVDTTKGCEQSRTFTLNAPTSNTGFTILKAVQGNLDSGFSGGATPGHADAGSTANYRLTWSNVSGSPIQAPVIYDKLPRPDDTRMDGTARSSQFGVALAAAVSAPAGVEVQYSTADNPCMPELKPANPGCEPTWSTQPPADLSKVTALRFASAASFAPGEFLQFSFAVTVPHAEKYQVAWNSAAGVASQDGQALLPYESANAGLMVCQQGDCQPVVDNNKPSFVKTVDKPTAFPGDTLTYSLTVKNPTAENLQVVVQDILPSGFTFVSASHSAQAIPDTDPPIYAFGTTGDFVVAANATAAITFTGTIAADAPIGSTLVNAAAAGMPAHGSEVIGVNDLNCPPEFYEQYPLAASCATTRVLERPTLTTVAVSKALDNPAGIVLPADLSFTVDYSWPAAENYPASSGTLTVAASGAAATISDVPVGAVISFTERDPAPITGASWTLKPVANHQVSAAANAVTVTNILTKDPLTPPVDPPAPPQLPRTGVTNPGAALFTALALVLVGGALTIGARRRHHA